VYNSEHPKYKKPMMHIANAETTSSSAIVERLRFRVGQSWPKVKDNLLSSTTVT